MRFDVNENVKSLWRVAHILLILADMTQDPKKQDDISEKNIQNPESEPGHRTQNQNQNYFLGPKGYNFRDTGWCVVLEGGCDLVDDDDDDDKDEEDEEDDEEDP